MNTNIIRRSFEYLRESFWAIPIIILVAGALFAILNLWLDTHLSPSVDFANLIGFSLGGYDSFRSVLSTTAAAILGVAGVSFSITIASLTLASQQYGPRLIRTFTRDRFIQLTLGFFTGTFVYCMLSMQLVAVVAGDTYVPAVSLGFVLLLTFIDLVLLIMFIHHICVSIQVDSVINEVVNEMQERAASLFSESYTRNTDISESENAAFDAKFSEDDCFIASEGDGYITFIDYQALLQCAEEKNIYIDVLHRAGDYVMQGEPLIRTSQELESSLLEQLRCNVSLSETRTPEQDLEYTVRQLVEIALRSLSPGINDPFTAITCIDRLGSLLNFIGKKSLPPSMMQGTDGLIRVRRNQTSYSSIVETAFNQIRQISSTHIDVSIRLLEVLHKTIKHSNDSEQAQHLILQAQLVSDGIDMHDLQDHDKCAIKDRYNEILELKNTLYPTIATENA